MLKSLWESETMTTFASVFFIVLDLRLTRFLVTSVTLFLFPSLSWLEFLIEFPSQQCTIQCASPHM